MSDRYAALSPLRRSALTLSLSAALGLVVFASDDASASGLNPSTSHTVTTCADDDSPGSLRAIIASPNTGDGDTIDLSQLACSTITLDAATHSPSHITIPQPSLHLIGPGSGALTIDGGFHSSVLRHIGNGTLELESLSITQGKYVSANNPFGGCIYSSGSVTLTNARVEACSVTGTGAEDAKGGAVYTVYDLRLDRSVITNSGAHGDGNGSNAFGGGAYVGRALHAGYSTVSDNAASGQYGGMGGGAFVVGPSVTIMSSTIHSNHAFGGGGIVHLSQTGLAQIANSTFSGNYAVRNGALATYGSLDLSNSTVAFNHETSYATPSLAGIALLHPSSLVLESSIISGNSGPNGPADLFVYSGTTFSGSNNLVIEATGVSLPPADCPRLDVLRDNGGPTLTHGLGTASPAIDAGSNPDNLVFDQTGNFRVVGPAADIGALESRSDLTPERVFVAGFDGLCDQ